MQHILGQVRRCVEDYHMIEAGDKVAVGVSGGKDSLLTLTALARLRDFYPIPFQVEAITLETGTPGMSFDAVAELCRELEVPYTRIHVPVYQIVFEERKEKNPCSLCAKLRRGSLNTALTERGIHKIALGHHYDDVIETILMGMLYGAQVQTMMPKLHSTNFEGMELIRPLYLIREADIIHWANYNDLHFIQCACRFTEHCASCGGTEKGSKRAEIKELIHELAQKDPVIEYNIFRSVENVNLNTVIGYKQDGVRHNFLDTYDEQK